MDHLTTTVASKGRNNNKDSAAVSNKKKCVDGEQQQHNNTVNTKIVERFSLQLKPLKTSAVDLNQVLVSFLLCCLLQSHSVPFTGLILTPGQRKSTRAVQTH